MYVEIIFETKQGTEIIAGHRVAMDRSCLHVNAGDDVLKHRDQVRAYLERLEQAIQEYGATGLEIWVNR